MKMPIVSRVLFCIMGVWLPVGSHLADYGPTHIFNPHWPPHAKFHTGQTLGFSIVLGLLTIYFANRKTNDRALTLIATVAVASAYWLTQGCAILYPGTAFSDPEFNAPAPFGLPAQVVVEIVALAIIALATVLAGKKDAKWGD